jgi:hypothetical protein
MNTLHKTLRKSLFPVLLLAFAFQGQAQGSLQGQLTLAVKPTDTDHIFLSTTPVSIAVSVANTSQQQAEGQIVVNLTTDDYQPVKNDSLPFSLAAKEGHSYSFGLSNPVPGFYRYHVKLYQKGQLVAAEKLNVGYEPEKINSPLDAHADFTAFWQNSLKELAKVAPAYELTLIPDRSGADYTMYLVKMRSFGNEPIQGYYAQPKREGRHPVIVEYMGYGSQPYFPTQSFDGYAHFVLSIRGQALNQPGHRFGPAWITYGLDSKENYYYRGAFLDVCTAPQKLDNNIWGNYYEVQL